MHTEISIGGFAELSPSSKTEIKWQLIRFAQLASILNGHESIIGVVISHKPVVVPVTDYWNISNSLIQVCVLFLDYDLLLKGRSGGCAARKPQL